MFLNKRGAALFQVLIVTAILAGMAAMILRLSLSRTINSRKARHTIAAQTLIESCMAKVNALWAAKTPEAYARDLKACQMCDPTVDASAGCSGADSAHQIYTCENIDIYNQSDNYTVTAKIETVDGGSSNNPPCKITYTIVNGQTL